MMGIDREHHHRDAVLVSGFDERRLLLEKLTYSHRVSLLDSIKEFLFGGCGRGGCGWLSLHRSVIGASQHHKYCKACPLDDHSYLHSRGPSFMIESSKIPHVCS